MSPTAAEGSTPPALPLSRPEDLEPLEPVRRLPGRNRTKADIVVYRHAGGQIAVKDYRNRSWAIRNTVGRLMTRRETAAYLAAGDVPGLPRFLGRLGPFALATEWVEAHTLADCPPGGVPPERFERLRAVVDALHARGVALADLHHRDVLLADDGAVYVIDLAMARVLGRRPGPIRRRLFEHFRQVDLWAVTRLRARFSEAGPAAADPDVRPATVAWHRRVRRIKRIWNRLRGAGRAPR